MTYNEIQNYNHDVTFSFPFERWTDGEARAKQNPNDKDFLSGKADLKNLLKKLEDLKGKEWLNPSNEPAPGYNDALRYEVNARH